MSQPATAPRDETGEFVQQLTAAQSRLYSYICTLLCGAAGANDVLQETNLALWEKRSEYDRARPFLAWGYRFAYLQVLCYRKRRGRQTVLLDDVVLEQLAVACEQEAAVPGDHLDALEECLERLPERHREAISQRYVHDQPLTAIGSAQGQAAGSVAAMLYRIRKTLADCVEHRLAGGNTR